MVKAKILRKRYTFFEEKIVNWKGMLDIYLKIAGESNDDHQKMGVYICAAENGGTNI